MMINMKNDEKLSNGVTILLLLLMMMKVTNIYKHEKKILVLKM